MKASEEQLLHRYLDGAISPEEFEALEELLRGDAEARRTLRTLATIDSKWQELALEDPARPMPERSPFWRIAAALLALLVVGAVLAWWISSDTPPAIARVVHIEGQAIANGQRELADADELQAGDQITMEAGLVELAYRESGVHVLVTAPFDLQMDSTMRVNLRSGEMKLVVPPQGVGFVVDTPERQITDLGTRFVVKANESGSRVLVLEGKVAVHEGDGVGEQLMLEGDLAKFGRDGEVSLRRTEQNPDILERSITPPTPTSLQGRIFGFADEPPNPRTRPKQDVMARHFLPLVESGFKDRTSLGAMKEGDPLRFSGIAGSYREFPDHAGLPPYSRENGWMVWYEGKVRPPKAGRYRFWGYADNHLMVAIDGKPVFEGSRRDSPFKELGIPRTDHPSYPCLNATAGLACGSWFELTGDPVQIDLMFGEIMNHQTSGLLLIEREGESYEETTWGQPRFALFLTEPPSEEAAAELDALRSQMESKLMGSFSISPEAAWEVGGE